MRARLIALLIAPLAGCAGAHGRTVGMDATTPARTPARIIDVELLALDLASCGRCTGTERSLDAAVGAARGLLREAGVELRVTKRVIRSADEAVRHRLVTSPTIRIDGRDIAPELRESDCGDCAELCGCSGSVDCRVWVWEGREHVEAPRALVVDAILRAYGAGDGAGASTESAPAEYRLPENLRAFFAAAAARAPTAETPAGAPCCGEDPGCCAGAASPAGGARRAP